MKVVVVEVVEVTFEHDSLGKRDNPYSLGYSMVIDSQFVSLG
jgi:hypothetical protein